jgi:hypothetical protein
MIDAATLTKPDTKSTGMNNSLYRRRPNARGGAETRPSNLFRRCFMLAEFPA